MRELKRARIDGPGEVVGTMVTFRSEAGARRPRRHDGGSQAGRWRTAGVGRRLRAVLACGAVVLVIATPSPAGALPEAGLVNVAAAAGIAETTLAYHVSVANYDGVPGPDFFFNRRWKTTPRLYRNIGGGRFAEDTRTAFPIADRLDCEWGDPNVDGRPDLYCAVGAKHGTAVKANELWIQQPDGSFVNQAAAWGVTDPYGRGRQLTFLNFNGDAYPDLFVGNEYPRKDKVPSPNRLFINVGGTRFQELAMPGLTAEIGSRCAQAADIDRNGLDDLIVCGDTALRIYRNLGNNQLQDMAPSLGIAKRHSQAVAVDLDRDGDLDLVLTSGTRTRVRLQTGAPGQWQFGPAQLVAAGDIMSVATPDIDGDGDIDLYLVRKGKPNQPDYLALNNGAGAFTTEVVGASTKVATAAMAQAIDPDGDRRDAVLVVNSDSSNVPGPLELMALP